MNISAKFSNNKMDYRKNGKPVNNYNMTFRNIAKFIILESERSWVNGHYYRTLYSLQVTGYKLFMNYVSFMVRIKMNNRI